MDEQDVIITVVVIFVIIWLYLVIDSRVRKYERKFVSEEELIEKEKQRIKVENHINKLFNLAKQKSDIHAIYKLASVTLT